MKCVWWFGRNICILWYSATTNFLTLLVGGHWLLFWLSGPLDMPYSVELQCVDAFGGCIKLNTWVWQRNNKSDICCKCTLRGMSAEPLPKRESQSSWLVLTWSMSAWRLPAIYKTEVFIAKKWWEIMRGGVYDIICAALWQWSGYFCGKHCWTHSSTVFP